MLRHVTYLIETEEVLRQHLATNVRTRRHAAGLTLKQASEQAKMNSRLWQKIEAAEVNATLSTLARLGRVLGVNGVELLRAP
jgi:transcriptional regulator with XRE-family HTH domain